MGPRCAFWIVRTIAFGSAKFVKCMHTAFERRKTPNNDMQDWQLPRNSFQAWTPSKRWLNKSLHSPIPLRGGMPVLILWTWRLKLTTTDGIGTVLPCPHRPEWLKNWIEQGGANDSLLYVPYFPDCETDLVDFFLVFREGWLIEPVGQNRKKTSC